MKSNNKELIIGAIIIGVIVIAAITVAIILLTAKEPVFENGVKSLTLDQTNISEEIIVGEESVAALTAITKNITEELVWASSNEDVATVEADGNTAVITLKAAGSATITVKAGELGALCQVVVKEVESKITIDPKEIVEGIVKGSTKVVTLTATLENIKEDVVWSVDNDKVATIVGNGETAELTLKEVGEAVVTAKAGDKTATCNVKVNDVTSMITLKTTSINKQIKRGSTATQTLEVTLLNVTGDLKWTSSNEKVARVDKIDTTKAKVTLVSAGNATITVTDGTVKATCNVKVTYPAVSLTLNKTSIKQTIIAGKDVTIKNALTATLKNATGTINWKSSNTSVATVSKTGTTVSINALEAGTTTITATCKVDGKTYSAKCIVTVTSVKPKVKLNKASITGEIVQGETVKLSNVLIATLENATGTVYWKSSNTSVATVNESGATATITLKAVGTTTITATCKVDGVTYSAECIVTVKEKPITTVVKLDKTSIKAGISYGVSQKMSNALTATVENGTGTVYWTSSNPSVATVNESGITATLTLKAAGTTTITAKVGNATATCRLDVTAVQLLSSSSVYMQVGETKEMQIKVHNLLTGDKVIWSFINNDGNGILTKGANSNTQCKFTARKPGKEYLKASVNGGGVFPTIVVQVPQITGIKTIKGGGGPLAATEQRHFQFETETLYADYCDIAWKVTANDSTNTEGVKSYTRTGDVCEAVIVRAGTYTVTAEVKYDGASVIGNGSKIVYSKQFTIQSV